MQEGDSLRSSIERGTVNEFYCPTSFVQLHLQTTKVIEMKEEDFKD